MIIDIFGTDVEVLRKDQKWVVFYRGNEGKKRLAKDIVIPSDINATGLVEYLSDLFHERATRSHPVVKIVD